MIKQWVAVLLTVTMAMTVGPCVAFAQQEGEPVEETDAVDEPAADGTMLEGELDPAVEEVAPEAPPAPAIPQRRQPTARPVRRPSPRPRVPQPVAPPAPRSTPTSVVSGEKSGGSTGPNGVKDGESASEAVSFDYDGVELFEVIRSIAALTGKNFDIDPNIGATQVTLITHDKIPPEMAYAVLESILATRGFSMVETLDGHLIKIIPTPDATQSEKPPLVRGMTPVGEGYDGYATHIVPIKYASPEELREVLTLLGSRNARVDAYLPTNTLIITDTSDGLRRMFGFLAEADIPGTDTHIEIFTLEYTRAEILQQQLEQVLLDSGGPSPAGRQAATPVRTTTRRPTTRPVPGAPQSQVIGSSDEILRMVPDERLNSLIVVATLGMMERTRDLITKLDTPTPYEANNLHVYELLNADAEQVESALQPLVSTAPRRGGGGGGGAAAGGGGAGATAEVQPFEQQVQLTRYDQTNSLLIVASPQDYKVLEAFVARLDVPQRQVHVDAVVMDVTITDDFSVGVEAAGLGGNDGFGLTSSNRLLEIAQAANGLATDGADTAALAGAGTGLALGILGLGTGGGLTAGIFDDLTIDVNGTDVSIPFVPLLFQAIEQITDLEVLSQPSVTTVDNEEASISVGQEVPFVTNQRRSNNTNNQANNNFSFNNFNSITREDVGVQLTVTPQISEGDNVLLEMSLEISDLDAQQVGDVNLLGPTTNKSLIENKVLVKDGSTAVLAGLIRDTADRGRRQAPVLGDVPVLGWLFRSKSANRMKRNLVVLVTPHIVKEGVDFDRITKYKVGQYYDQNVEELMERSFFKKVRRKADQRKTWRPTSEQAEGLTGQRSTNRYGRGDLKR